VCKLTPVILAFLAAVSLAQDYPVEPGPSEMVDPFEEMARLGKPFGIWQGWIRPIRDPMMLMRNEPEGYQVQVTIRADSAEIMVSEGNGEVRHYEGEIYIYNAENTVLINYINRNGGGFVEFQTLALSQVEPARMRGFVSRVVHNLVVKPTSPWRVMPVYSEVELERL